MSKVPMPPLARTISGGWIPAEPGLWILIFGDLFVFTLFFGTFAYYRIFAPVVFHASQAELNQSFGLFNTALLLTSSWFVVNALESSRHGDARVASRWALTAMALGFGFIIIKILEYREKISAGLTPASNDFFMLYFVFTGIHLVHVVIGIAALAFMRATLFKPASAGRDNIIEACAIFWHMVDILWVVLFAIFYLHR